MSKTVKRLHHQFQPEKYQLDITPDAEAMTFEGLVEITGQKAGRPSRRITFHQKGLRIKSASLVHIDKRGAHEIKVTRINLQKKLDELRLHANNLLYPGKYKVTIEFRGEITTSMHGLYPCNFQHKGKSKKLLATQFESHHAREVFPCIDEPEAKATFDLALNTTKDLGVLANTPIASQKMFSTGLIKTKFETSPPMSTYLLAFVIGEVHCVEAKTRDGIAVRTWGSAAQPADVLQYANDEAVKILEYFSAYFDTPFPLKKLDQIALPDFESGAMENWGLITYREIALLADPENRSQSSEQYVSMVVAHEISHQWFGNLVTMKWWDDLWLNESFASLMEHIALDALHPDWFQWEQYTAMDVITCSSRDVFKDVQPVRVNVKHPDEISTLFDPAIVYAKGGRLLKMMREYIGDAAFRTALKAYFDKHAYKNTSGDDLWAEMSSASGKNIKEFMDPWLTQSGMPQLSVLQKGRSISLSQKRIVLDTDDTDSVWPVPLLADQEIKPDMFDSFSGKAEVSEDEKPVIFNHSGSGHMVVKYEDSNSRDYIALSFTNQSMQPESRINHLNDLLLLARKGELPLTDSLDVIAKSSEEPREAVWTIMARAIATAIALTEGDEQTEKYIYAYRRKLAGEFYEQLGWDDQPGDTTNQKSLRQTILSIMVASEEPSALSEAKRRYKAASSALDLPAEQRGMIISALIRSGEDISAGLIEEYKTTPNPDVQLAISAGLTTTKNAETGRVLIESALSEEGFVRPQDIFRWYAYLMRNRHTRHFAWQWLKDNWKRLEKLFGDSKSFEYFIVYSAAPINTPDMQKEFKQFFGPKEDVIALRRSIKIAYSEIDARVAWRNREEKTLRSHFSNLAKQYHR